MKTNKGGTAPTLTRVVCGFADIKVLVAKGRYHVQLPEVRSGHGGLSTINNDYKSYYHTHKYYGHVVVPIIVNGVWFLARKVLFALTWV